MHLVLIICNTWIIMLRIKRLGEGPVRIESGDEETGDIKKFTNK